VGTLLLLITFGLLVPTVLLLVYVMTTRRVGLHAIWELALTGDRLSRIYVVMSLGTFGFAVVSVLLILPERS
jgi:hypothetical protein